MAVIATQAAPSSGAALTYSAASGGGDRFTPGRHVFLHIKNGSGSTMTATIVTPNSLDGLAVADRAVSIPATSDRIIPVGESLYASADGLADITYSLATSVTLAVVEV
jgi:hypothetical protein